VAGAPRAARSGGSLLMRHALQHIEQAAARHREAAAVAAGAAVAGAARSRHDLQPRHASCAASPAAAADQVRHHHHHRAYAYPLVMRSASASHSRPPSIWRAPPAAGATSASAAAAPPSWLAAATAAATARRGLSLLANLAGLVGSGSPPHDDGDAHGHATSAADPGAPRRAHRERRLVGYSPKQLFSVVADVASYREFVPWCRRSDVLRASEDGLEMEAELEVGFQALSERYVSRVRLQRPAAGGGRAGGEEEDEGGGRGREAPRPPPPSPSPPVAVVQATTSHSMLFEHLASTWTLRRGPQPGTTWLAFEVEFGFASAAHRHVADLFFDQVVRQMVAAFEGRCAELYGPSALGKRRRMGLQER